MSVKWPGGTRGCSAGQGQGAHIFILSYGMTWRTAQRAGSLLWGRKLQFHRFSIQTKRESKLTTRHGGMQCRTRAGCSHLHFVVWNDLAYRAESWLVAVGTKSSSFTGPPYKQNVSVNWPRGTGGCSAGQGHGSYIFILSCGMTCRTAQRAGSLLWGRTDEPQTDCCVVSAACVRLF